MRVPVSRRRITSLALGLGLVLAAAGCGTGPHYRGPLIPGIDTYGVNPAGTYGIPSNATVAWSASGRGGGLSDNVGVSTHWALRWSYHCGGGTGRFEAIPVEQAGSVYRPLAGDPPVVVVGSQGSGERRYSGGSETLVRVRAPHSCRWSVRVLNLWAGGPSHD